MCVSKKLSSKPLPTECAFVVGAMPSSLLVNIPDWSKILRDEYKENTGRRERKPVREKRKEKNEERGERKENKNYKNFCNICPYRLI